MKHEFGTVNLNEDIGEIIEKCSAANIAASFGLAKHLQGKAYEKIKSMELMITNTILSLILLTLEQKFDRAKILRGQLNILIEQILEMQINFEEHIKKEKLM